MKFTSVDCFFKKLLFSLIAAQFISAYCFSQDFRTNGTAFRQNGECYQLTTEGQNQNASVLSQNMIDLSQDFYLEAKLNFGDRAGFDGADGIAFVFATTNAQVGTAGAGAGMGYAGIDPILAVEMDCFENPPVGDPPEDHMAIMNGNPDHLNSMTNSNLAGPVGIGELEDGQDKCFSISWSVADQTLRASIDGGSISYTGDIVNDVFFGTSRVHYGFTAATGRYFNNQSVCINTGDPVNPDPMADVTICEGESVILEPYDAGLNYEWDPPTDLSDPFDERPRASPTTTTTYSVDIELDCGFGTITDDIIVTVIPAQDPIVSSNSPLCQGQIIELFCSHADSYDWRGPNGFRSSDQNPIVGPMSFIRAGIYTVTITIGGCQSTSSVTVRLDNSPTVTVDPIPILCELDGSYFPVANPPGGEWRFDIAPDGTIDPLSLGVGNYMGQYYFENSGGCKDSVDVLFEVAETPIAEISDIDPLCESGDPIDLRPYGIPAGGVWSGDVIGNNFDPESTGPGTYQVTYEYTDANGCSAQANYDVEVNAGPSVEIVNPPKAICLEVDSVLLVGNPTGGVWSDSINANGWFHPQNYGIDTVPVTYTYYENGCPGEIQIDIAIVEPKAIAFTSVNQYCGVDSTSILIADPTGGTWSGDVSATGQFNPSILGAGNYTANYAVTDTFGCSQMSAFNFTIIATPPVSFSNTGPFCVDLTNAQITATPVGGTFGGVADASGNINPQILGVGFHEVTYTFTDAGGCVNSARVQVEISGRPTVSIDPVNAVCPELTSVILTGNPAGGVWGGAANAAGEVNPSALGSGTHNVTYTFTTPQNCSATANLNINVTTPPTAEISGNETICPGANNTVNLLVSLTGSGPWQFTFAIDGNPQAPVSTSSNPYMLPVSQTGDYTIVSVTDNSGCQAAGSGTGTVMEITPLQIQNIETVCNSTNTGYSVQFEIVGGDPATYAVTGLTGNITPAAPYIFTSSDVTNGQQVSFQVTDMSGCLPVDETVQFDCDCETAVGEMGTDQINICGTGQATADYDNSNEIRDGDDVLIYVLHTNSGISLGTVLATNNQPSFTYMAGMVPGTTYYISAVVGNTDGAGSVDFGNFCTQVAPGTPVVWHEIPEVILSGPTSVCEGEMVALELQLTGQSPWDVQYSDGTGTFDLIGITSSPFQFTVSPTGPTTYELVSVRNAFCDGNVSGTVAVDINRTPEITNVMTECDINKTFYTVTFEIMGGEPSTYNVTGAGTLTGNTFLSDQIPNGNGYSFSVNDGNNCGQDEISAPSVLCDCESDAGTFSAGDLEACVDETIQATHLGDQFLDANDVFIFVLHDGSASNIGSILAQNSVPEFSFTGSMTPGTSYYITAVAGNNDGSGGVDLTDGCRSIANGVQVIFNALPTAEFAGDETICEGQEAVLTIRLTGEGSYNVTIFDGSQNVNLTGISDGEEFRISPTQTTVYEIVSVEDDNCRDVISNQATVTVNDLPEATLAAGADICNTNSNNDPTSLDFSSLILSGDMTGTWREISSVSSGAAGVFPILDFDGVDPGQYEFEYTTASAVAPCDNRSFSIMITVRDCACPSVSTATGGPLCSTNAVLDLSSITITTESGNWSIINEPAGSTADISGGIFNATGSPEGSYELEFRLTTTPAAGCDEFSTQTIIVLDPPSATLTSSGEICNTDSNNDPTVFDFSTLITGGDQSGTWSETSGTPSGASGTFPNLDFDGVPEGTYTFRYTTGSAQLPCDEVSYDVTLTVRDCSCPSVGTIGAGPFCNDDARLDLSTITISGEPGTWSIITAPSGSTANISGGNFDATGSVAGDYVLEFRLDQMPAAGCEEFSTQTITVSEFVSAGTSSGLIQICNDDSSIDLIDHLTGETAGGIWTEHPSNPTTGFLNAGILSLSGIPAGRYGFDYSVTADAPCDDDTETVFIEIDNPVDAGEVIGDVNVCTGIDTTFSLFDLIQGNNPGGVWTDISSVPMPAANFNNLNAVITTNNAPVGTYRFRYLLQTLGICPSDEVIVEVFVNETPTADAGQDQSLTCDVRRVTIGGTGSASGANISYNWTNGAVTEPNSLLTEATDPGVYILNVRNDLTGCSSSDLVEVGQIGDLPALELSNIEIDCHGDSNGVILVDEVTGGIPPYVYSINGGNFSTQDFFRNLAPGSYIVAVEDSNGCGDEKTFEVEEPSELTVDLTVDLRDPNEPIQLGDGVELTAYVRGDFDSLTWTPEGFFNCDPVTDPFQCLVQYVEPVRTTTYGIEIFNGNGCSARSSITINVANEDGEIYVPTGFSPNNDGYNDWLYVYGGQDVERINTFLIFDRWGDIVWEYHDFEWDDPAGGWDGYHKGKLMNDQVFVYLVEVLFKNGKKKIFEGDVLLLK